MHVAKRRHLTEGFQLHLPRQGTWESVYIELLCALPFRFEEKLVALFVSERHDLCLDAGTIARADTTDLAVVEWRWIEVITECGMHFRIGVYDIAAAWPQASSHTREKWEFMKITSLESHGGLPRGIFASLRYDAIVAILALGKWEIYGTGINACRSACLHT